MSNMMIYARKGAVGGSVENVWGYAMQVCTIDSSDEKAVEAAKANGYSDNPNDVIEQIETQKLEAENKVMKGKLDGVRAGDTMKNPRIDELEEQLAEALTEVAQLEAKLAIYEETKDVNGDGVVSYDEMEVKELHALLDQRGVKYVSRDTLKDLIQKAKDSE